MRLHRLCDAVETVTRFFTFVSLGEVGDRLGRASLPEDLLRELQPQIERPTFGQWKNMLEAVIQVSSRVTPLVVQGLPDLIKKHLLPALSGGDSTQPDQSLIRLRNDLVHGGGLKRAAAQEYLTRWEPWLEQFTSRLSLFEDVNLCQLVDGIARRLVGPNHRAGGECPLSREMHDQLRDRDGHVILLSQERWLDLWPLCDYGRACIDTAQGRRQASAESPQIYVRFQRDRLVYTAPRP